MTAVAIIGAAAAVPALAAPAVAAIMPETSAALPIPVPTSSADAKLLALSPKLEALIADWKKRCSVDDRRHRSDEAARRRAGMPQIKFGSIPDDDWRAYQDKRMNIRGKYFAEEEAETNERGENVVWNGLFDRKSALIDAIYSYRAQTAAGLAVQARAYSFDWIELWFDGDESQEDGRRFSELVCAFTGVTPVALDGKITKHRKAAKGPKNPDATLVRARAQMVELTRTIHELVYSPPYRHVDCEDVPGYSEADDRLSSAIAALEKTPARSFEGLIAKAQAVAEKSFQEREGHHRAVAISLANDLLAYFGSAA
jgi:hypothetical protein